MALLRYMMVLGIAVVALVWAERLCAETLAQAPKKARTKAAAKAKPAVKAKATPAKVAPVKAAAVPAAKPVAVPMAKQAPVAPVAPVARPRIIEIDPDGDGEAFSFAPPSEAAEAPDRAPASDAVAAEPAAPAGDAKGMTNLLADPALAEGLTKVVSQMKNEGASCRLANERCRSACGNASLTSGCVMECETECSACVIETTGNVDNGLCD